LEGLLRLEELIKVVKVKLHEFARERLGMKVKMSCHKPIGYATACSRLMSLSGINH